MFATDWYPFAIAAAGSGSAPDTIFVANKKGLGSRAADSSGNYHSTGMIPTVNVIDSSAPFADAAVRSANAPFAAASPRPGSPGTLASLGIQHVFLVIKENRTYDQVLGDLSVGNRASQLVTYGSAVTPNQHALASQFVVLDNFYASGTVSADGHQWLAQAMTSDYAERAANMRTPQYDADEVLSWVSSGFIWTNVLEHGLTATIFGEMAQPAQAYTASWSQYYSQVAAPQVTLPLASISFLPAFSSLVQPNYPGWALNIPDVLRARLFTERLNQYQAEGDLPNLIIVYLPTDHTAGLSPGFPTPAAMVADNDLATGRVIEAITKSTFWPGSAILVTEDDAQDGVDHVDGHRTLCFVVSPYARRGDLDSTQYNHTSVLRTIEEMLGLPPMNKFDAAALPMRSAFTATPNLTGFAARANTTALDTLNPAAAALRGPARRAARDSAKMDFSRPDAAPERKLNEILWHAARGWQTPYPAGKHRSTDKKDAD
jgi:hypothetical protein